jgi:hypothetical protein
MGLVAMVVIAIDEYTIHTMTLSYWVYGNIVPYMDDISIRLLK